MAIEVPMPRSATANPSLTPRRALVPVALLAVLLFLAQLGLLLHGLEHDAAEPDAYCALCIASQHVGDAVPMAAAIAVDAARTPALSALRPAPARAAQIRSFLVRAPPVPSLS